MRIQFCLGWWRGNVTRRAFKSEASFTLFAEYCERVSRFDPCAASGFESSSEKKVSTKRWLCEPSKTAKLFSSVELAGFFQKLRDTGTKELQIIIGPADGFSAKEAGELKPDLLWSFGPLTFPHELASVIAAEQLYRAYTIIQRLPYHSGH